MPGLDLAAAEGADLQALRRDIGAFLADRLALSGIQRAEEIRDLLLNIESCNDVRAISARLGAP